MLVFNKQGIPLHEPGCIKLSHISENINNLCELLQNFFFILNSIFFCILTFLFPSLLFVKTTYTFSIFK